MFLITCDELSLQDSCVLVIILFSKECRSLKTDFNYKAIIIPCSFCFSVEYKQYMKRKNFYVKQRKPKVFTKISTRFG